MGFENRNKMEGSSSPGLPFLGSSPQDSATERSGFDLGSNGIEQENIVSSSLSLRSHLESSDDEDTATATGSCVSDEETLHAMIDALEHDVMEVETESTLMKNGSEDAKDVSEVRPKVRHEGHSVEYWTVGSKGRAKNLVKTYSINQSISNEALFAPFYNGTSISPFGLYPPSSQGFVGCDDYNTNASQTPIMCSNLNSQLQPHSSGYAFPQNAAVMHQPSLQILVPPKQSSQQPQFIQMPGVPQYIPPTTAPFSSYIHPFYAPSTPLAVSYYQGPPLFYQPTSVPNPMPMSPFSFGNQNEFCSPLYQGASTSLELPFTEGTLTLPGELQQANGQIENRDAEPDSTTLEIDSNLEKTSDHYTSETHNEALESGTPWKLQDYFVTSSSDTNPSKLLLDPQHLGAEEEVASNNTSGYGSISSSPVSAGSRLSSDYTQDATLNISNDSGNGNVSNSGSSEADSSDFIVINNEETTGLSEIAYASNAHFGINTYERFAQELRVLNDARMDSIIQDVITLPVPYRQDLVYPGNLVILIYSQNDGTGSVIMYNSQELPYVASAFDPRVQIHVKMQNGPMCYSYYVPPSTADNDFFGGQITMWQIKMVQYFLKYHPHNWKMHGVPETFNLEMFLGSTVDVIGEFQIVSKLRFCCRTCKTPWTSKKGTIVFTFCYSSTFLQGWILMRIFGQICIKEDCADWSFQNPACYPEEIDRAVKKLSEYIGLKVYGIAVKPNSFAECYKSIRKGKSHGSSAPMPHKKDFCQACMNGVCKNLYALPSLFVADGKKPKPNVLRRKQSGKSAQNVLEVNE